MVVFIKEIKLKPIGIIHSPYKSRSAAPFQGIISNKKSTIEVFDEYIPALKDIETFNYIIIQYYAHEVTSFSLQTTTPWDTKSHGLFTTRSPYRPNSLLICVVKLIERSGNRLVVKYLDAIDGSPLIDIKPYLPGIDKKDDANSGWLEGKIKI
ncbi:MAG: tRNA (N6-threonylcarbamoyladenosine(37)-N6)-methyltransferase TrmO [Candidatus Lokiarchaeota archaeon]|nr:tRNA (N6-threonylcarbamoyladenosine(37)-N6)-methyltransferase TrmO [Candidatus Lokiarchaeota archaeon]